MPRAVAACGCAAACLPDACRGAPQEPMDLYDDDGLVRRGGRWEALAPDECVVAVEGRAPSIVA